MDGLCVGLCALLLGDTVISATILGKIRKTAERCEGDSTEALTPVSYTHLDVYKRQPPASSRG